MPSKPPAQRRAGSLTAKVINSPSRKLTTTERGYGWEHQQQRRVILIEEPLCRFCAETGLVVVATEIDHIDGDPFNRNRDNCRPLCRPRHLLRTPQEQAFGKDQWRPKWLRPSTIPLTIVCGPPASGKSLYVRRHRHAGDLVIDLDMIASVMSGSSLHGWDRGKQLTPAMRQRNELRPTDRWPAPGLSSARQR